MQAERHRAETAIRPGAMECAGCWFLIGNNNFNALARYTPDCPHIRSRGLMAPRWFRGFQFRKFVAALGGQPSARLTEKGVPVRSPSAASAQPWRRSGRFRVATRLAAASTRNPGICFGATTLGRADWPIACSARDVRSANAPPARRRRAGIGHTIAQAHDLAWFAL
jgi:hypothetical protein